MTWRLLLITAFTVVSVTAAPCPALAGYLYDKNYIVRRDQGQDILCDPYVVRKNDWVIKLFSRRGQIAEQDFPEFLRIFQRLNPHVADIDKILPGQHILIPLKKLENESFPGQSSGIVTIPFVAISRLPEFIKKGAIDYTVKPGDNVSILISSGYGKFGTQSYRKGIALFKLINPEITDLNLIYPGQTIYIPNPGLQDSQWYMAMFDESGKINTDIDVRSLVSRPDQPKAEPRKNIPVSPLADSFVPAQPAPPEKQEIATGPAMSIAAHGQNMASLKKAATALNAKVLDKGTYYFPGQGKKDFKLDLSRYPVMELADGDRLLFGDKDDFSISDKQTLTSFWKNLKIVPLALNATFEQAMEAIFASNDKYDVKNRLTFDDQGTVIDIKARWIIRSGSSQSGQRHPTTCIFLHDEAGPPLSGALARYLDEWQIMIRVIASDGSSLKPQTSGVSEYARTSQNISVSLQKNLNGIIDDTVTAMGCHYSEQISISFPYSGVQVNALSNLISTPKGGQLLVDYGDLYGDALTAIRKTGLNIIQLGGVTDWQSALKTIFRGLNFPLTEHLDFKALVRPEDAYIHLHVPGLVVETDAKAKFLITPAPLRSTLAQFIEQSGYTVIMASDVK